MRVHILDDWADTLRGLPSFARLHGHDVTVWTDHAEGDVLTRRLQDAEALARLIDAVVAAGGNPKTGLKNKEKPALIHQVKAINTTNAKTGKPSAQGFGAHNAIVIAKLLEIGADPNEADENKTTPLIAAMTSATMTEEERLEVVKLLVGHGANPNAKNKKGETPKRLVAKGSPIEDVLKRPRNYQIKK